MEYLQNIIDNGFVFFIVAVIFIIAVIMFLRKRHNIAMQKKLEPNTSQDKAKDRTVVNKTTKVVRPASSPSRNNRRSRSCSGSHKHSSYCDDGELDALITLTIADAVLNSEFSSNTYDCVSDNYDCGSDNYDCGSSSCDCGGVGD